MNLNLEQSISEDTEVLNSLLSNLKTGIVKRQSMRRLPNYDLTTMLNSVNNTQVYKNENSPKLQRKQAEQTEKPRINVNMIKQTPVLVIPNSQQLTPADSPLPTTPSTVKFRRNLYNFTENRE